MKAVKPVNGVVEGESAILVSRLHIWKMFICNVKLLPSGFIEIGETS
jgi:hypothetical protein